MENEYNYDAIRPYTDEEVPEALKRVVTEPELKAVLAYLFPNKPLNELIQTLLSFHSVNDFQSKIVAPLMLNLVKKTSDGLDINGLEKLNTAEKYLFISNHRDIILDAALLNTLLITHGIETSENAIGDNLCVKPWITEMMKLNKNFIVQRSGSMREIFEASKRLSAYIRQNITEKRNSIWIAQREGRAKNADDRTQESLLKMLSMSAKKNLKKSFIELNLTPVSISYEYDACDFLKAKEFQQKRDNPDFRKSKDDDLLNMKTGLTGYKGRIHYEVTGKINDELNEILSGDDDRTAVLEKTARLIDRRIHKNYRLFPGNYVALDNLREESNFFGKMYSENEKEKFNTYIENQIQKIDMPQKDIPFLRNKLTEMYANPLINYLAAIEE
ncbi:MAG: 1-acyl-sn-glycerol-3-phosphate acyltransferase [Prevotellaceae bacterium]|jgi:hypothetical protein|nr:1-acyl-sn-glycerol-3-phosphate acyltransferase [Prevotellaceae bacterium]